MREGVRKDWFVKKTFYLAAWSAVACGCLGIAILAEAPSASAQTTGREFVVPMDNMKYGRVPSGLKVGDSIVWVNRDSVPHTVTARNRSFDLRLNPGQKVRQKLTKAGGFAFYCTLHPLMRGTLTVAAK